MAMGRIGKILNKYRSTTGQLVKVRQVIKLWRYPADMFLLSQYTSSFRETVITIAKDFADPDSDLYHANVSTYVKKTIIKLCKNFLERINTDHPFLHHVHLAQWSPVNA
jgi:hypothetical protein